MAGREWVAEAKGRKVPGVHKTRQGAVDALVAQAAAS
jgi:hypothetical protein